jgi:hypothetical protein
MPTRTRRSTLPPAASTIRRICRLRPSSITISIQALRWPWRSRWAALVVNLSPLSMAPARSRCIIASSGTLSIWTW